MKSIITVSEKETFNFAKKYAKNLKGGEVIGLIGELGAGKTIFAKGLATGLGVKDIVNSPTFTIMKVYKTFISKLKINSLVHIDAYRLKNPRDIITIGAPEYWQRLDAVTVIEWADKIKKIIPLNTILIHITIFEKEKRKIQIKKQ